MISQRRLLSRYVVPLTSYGFFTDMMTELYETEREDANKPITKPRHFIFGRLIIMAVSVDVRKLTFIFISKYIFHRKYRRQKLYMVPDVKYTFNLRGMK